MVPCRSWRDSVRPGSALSALLAALAFAAPISAQTGTVSGVVVDGTTGTPVGNADVRLIDAAGAEAASTVTAPSGAFTVAAAEGTYDLVVRVLGYRDVTVGGVSIAAAASNDLRVELTPAPFLFDEIVVTANRTETTAMAAPTAVSVIGREEIQRSTAFTPAELVLRLPDVNVSTKGISHFVYSTRGAAGTYGLNMRTLSDFRYTNMASLNLSIPTLVPTANEDLERVELIRGPASALYGPLGARGVLHFITRSPFDSEGTTFTVMGGAQSLFQGTFRHARRLSPNVAWKISGEYLSAEDWAYTDPVEAALRQDAIDGGADPDTLLIGARDLGIESFLGSTAVEWRPGEATTVVVSGGLASTTGVDAGSVGGTQVKDWVQWNAQARVNSGAFFANVFVNSGDAGSSFLLQTGLPLVDRSYIAVGQVQHGFDLTADAQLQYGADFQRTVPRTGGTIHGRNEDDDEFYELGGYLQVRYELTPQLEATATVRIDEHSRMANVTVSPMVGVVFRPQEDQAWRVTYNRAFQPVLASGMFLDLFISSFAPYSLRAAAPPPEGFRFRRDCGGLCMRSPFNPGGPDEFLPADATVAWDAYVQLLLDAGIDISAIPAPTAADVPSVLSIPAEEVIDIPGPAPQILSTIEVGYKGLIGDRAYLTVDVHRTSFNEASSGFDVITPTVTLEEAALATYLGQYMPQADADGMAAVISGIPGGTVTPANALDPFDFIVATTIAPEEYVRYGVDVGLEVQLTPELTVGGTYSWIDNDSIPDVAGFLDVHLLASSSKGSFRASYVTPRFSASVSGRAVRGYRFPVGIYANPIYGEVVPGYLTMDASVGVQVPWQGTSVTLSSTNVLDNRHVEQLGVAELGRLLMLRLRWEM